MLAMRRALLVCLCLAVAPRFSNAEPLPGTQALTTPGDLAKQMVEGIDRFLTRQASATDERRAEFWKPDYTSPAAYEASVALNRARLRRILGITRSESMSGLLGDPQRTFDFLARG